MYKPIRVLMPGVITGHAPNGIPKPGDCHTLLVLLRVGSGANEAQTFS